MSSLFFWNTWFKEYRLTWLALAAVFLFAMIFMWYSYFMGNNNVIHWENLQEQKVIETNVHTFRLGPFVLDIPGESYVILEYFQGSDIAPNTTASYLFLLITFVSLTVIISVVSTLDKIWFYVAVALYSVLIFSLRLEVIGIFGVYSKIVGAGAIGLYLLPAFYFNRIRPTTPFVIRLLIFTIITCLVGVAIGFFSTEPLPFYHLVLTSFTATLVISLIFMILVAHEIFAVFVYIASQGTKSIQHLSILSAIYFVNVLLTLAHELGLIDFDFIYLNVFLLLSLSAILGIWGFKSRQSVYENVFSFYPFGAFLFLALGAICFATIGHQLGNANDPGVYVLRHAILFTHAGYGVIFLMYILANFGQMLADNAPVFKVLFTPKRMPYFTYRLAGFIATLAIFIYANWRVYIYHSFSAFYNTAGDFYALQDDEDYAYNFYRKASVDGFRNHRSNYKLAVYNASRNDFDEARLRLEAANERRPSEYSLTNYGNYFIREMKTRESISAFRQNLTKMQDLAAVDNNLAVSYIKLHGLDSALHFLAKARDHKLTKNSAETNFFGLAAIERIPFNMDSIYRVFNNPSPAILANLYALSSVINRPVNIKVDPLAQKQLNLYTATYLNNYILKNARTLDTTFTNQAFRIASDSLNADYSEALKASLAYAFYHQGNIAKALEVLAEQVYLSQSYQGKFNYIMGLWALEQNNPELAASYFNFADTYRYKEAPFYNAIALTEAGDLDRALVAWDSVALRGDNAQKEISRNMKRILMISPAQASSLSDTEKYQFCRYRITRSDSILFDRVSSTFENDDYKAQAILDYSKRFFEAGEIVPAIRFYQRIAGLKLTNKDLYEDVRHFELRLLAHRGDLRGLANQINKGIEFTQARSLEKLYYSALLSEVNGDTATAKKNYAILARYNPYFEDGVLAAFNFFKKQNNGGFDAYNILAEAIQINGNSLPLLKAYYNEAVRVGLDEYAISTAQRISALQKPNR
jgi:hypothetical protein